MASLALYRRLLRTPHLRSLIALSLMARMPIGILSLGLVLFIREEYGSFATAGAVAGAFALAGGLFAPLQGRLVDRLGQTRVLVPLSVMNASALIAVLALGLAHAPAVAAAAAAGLAGAAIPPMSASFRPLLVEMLEHEPDLLPAGYALDSVIIEGVFIVGPLLTAALVAAFSPAAALVTGVALGLAGTLAFAALPASRAWRGQPRETGIAGALASAGMRTLVLTALPIGVCFGTLEVVLPAFGSEHGAASLGGVLFAGLSVGSIAGGIAYGVAAQRLGSLERGYLVLAVALPLSLALLALPDSIALMLLLVPVAGCVIAPITAAEAQLITAVAPRGTATEAVTWAIMATVVGVALGNAAAGAIAESAGWRPAMLAACGVALLGSLLAFTRRATLRPIAAQHA